MGPSQGISSGASISQFVLCHLGATISIKLERQTNNNNEKLEKWGNLGRLPFSCFLIVSAAFHPCFEVLVNSCFHGFVYVSAQQPLRRCQAVCCILGVRANARQGSSLHGVCVSTYILSHSVVSDSLRPCGLWPTRLLCPWDFPTKNTRVGCHFLLQGIFLTPGSNSSLLRWQADSLLLRHLGNPHVCLESIKEDKHMHNKAWCPRRPRSDI